MNRRRERLFHQVRLVILVLASAAAVIQLALDGSVGNMVSALFCLAGVALVAVTQLRTYLYDRYPVSAFSVFFFGLATLWLPLVVSTFIYWEPVSHNLQESEAVFGYSLAATVGLVFAHAVYQKWPNLNRVRFALGNAIERLGLTEARNNAQLWIVGIFGFLAIAHTLNATALHSGDMASPLDKFIMPFQALAYAPLAIAFRPFEHRHRERLGRGNVIALLTYGLAVLILSLVGNSRETFAFPLASLAMAFWIGILTGHVRMTRKVSRWVTVSIVCAMFILPGLARVSEAMLMARQFRGHVSYQQLGEMTMESFLRPKATESTAGGSDYDDFYYSDPFLSRLLNPKWSDNSLVVGEKIGDNGRAKLATLEAQKIATVLPAPILKVLGVQLDKQEINSFSVGDYEWYLYTGRGLGSMLTTSFIGDGARLLSFWFVPVTVLCAWFWFPIIDCLTRVARVPYMKVVGEELVPAWKYEARFSTLFVPTAFLLGSFFVQRTSMVEFILYFRDLLQLFLAYALIFWITGKVLARPRPRPVQVYA